MPTPAEPAMAQFTTAQPTIAQQRLAAQRITQPDFDTAAAVAQWLGALQAQDYTSGAWTIGLRLPSATMATIEQAIAARTIVRTWLLRGTLHMVAAADLKWMLTLLAPTVLARNATFYRQLGLDATLVSKGYAAITEALQGGTLLTRQELLAALAQAGLVIEGMPASNLLNRAALDGLICLGTMRGKQPTFALLDEWVPHTIHYARDEALAALALRYFTSHGPATLRDFAWWTGLLMEDARAGFEAVKLHLVEETVAGKSLWRAPTAAHTRLDTSRTDLLPGFDEFVLGYADRSDILTPEQEKMITGVNAIFAYTMVLDGRVVGTWKRTVRRHTVEITFAPFAPLPADTLQAFIATAQRYAEFLGVETVIIK
jgi:Winged helix DNA-binding domain